MEDKNLQLFYAGLDHALEGGWTETAPIIPEGWGKSVFTSIMIDLSFFYILFDLVKRCKSDILEKTSGIIEKMNVYKDVDFQRLTPEEIYKALSAINSNAARVLLSKIECTDGIYNELANSLSMRKQARFIDALFDCNTTSITQITQCIRFLQRQGQLFEYSKKKAFGNNSDDTGVQCIEDLKADYSLQSKELNNYQMQMIFFFNEVQENISNIFKEIEKRNVFDETSFREDNDSLCSYKYFTFLFRYRLLEDSGVLNIRTKTAFEFLFRLPAVKELYDEGLECWKSNSWKEKLAEFESRLLEIMTMGEGEKANDETEPSTPQIEKPATEDIKDALKCPQNTLGQGRGRHKGSWIKGRSQIKEEEVGALIQKNIWESLIKSVEKLKFKKGIEGIIKEKQVKNFSAGLLYYALEAIGWAKVYTTSCVQSSFERTMRFAGVARTSFEKNIRYIHEWYNLADEYKGHPNQFDDCYNTCKEKDPNMAFLIFENVNETGKIIDNLKVKLKKTLDESCKL